MTQIIFLMQVAGQIYSVLHSLRLIIMKTSIFHKIIAGNIIFSNTIFLLINALWQMGGNNSTADYNIFTLDYWLWTTWETHMILFQIYASIKIEKMYSEK